MEFTLIGRATVAARLVNWLAEDAPWDPVRVVTGSRGCGKSWFTSWAIMASDADAREYVPVVVDELPPVGTIDLALDCRQRTTAELIAALSQALLPDREPPPGNPGRLPLIELARAAERRGRAFTVALTDIADSGRLRGSGEAEKVLEHLVLPLVTAAERVRRSVKASRAPVRLLVDLPQDMAASVTADAGLPDPAVLDLDAAPFAPPRAEFGDWVRRLLAHQRGKRLGTEQQARTAQLICEQAWPNFVFAETLAIDYRSRPAASLPDSPDALPRGLAHAWHDMVTFRSAGQDRLDMVAAPIMLAQGELGMPESLCAEAVEALTGRACSVQDLRHRLDLLRPYVLMEQVETLRGPRAVRYFRPSDEALSDAVRSAYGSSAVEAERRIAQALARHIPNDMTGLLAPDGTLRLSAELEDRKSVV